MIEARGTPPDMSEQADNLRKNPPVLMNEREVAVFLDICARSVRNFTARKLLPVIRLGRRRLYRRDAVLAALRTLEVGGSISEAAESPVVTQRNWHELTRRGQR